MVDFKRRSNTAAGEERFKNAKVGKRAGRQHQHASAVNGVSAEIGSVPLGWHRRVLDECNRAQVRVKRILTNPCA
jgi:hypothetical protein